MIRKKISRNHVKGTGAWVHGPCSNEECGSSDAFAWREDEPRGYCFSCGKTGKAGDEGEPGGGPHFRKERMRTRRVIDDDYSFDAIENMESASIVDRKIRRNVCEHYGVKVDDENHFYPYTRNGKVVAYKRRALPKEFSTVGEFKAVNQLFGQAQAMPGRRLFITEGECDAMALQQAMFEKYQRFYPIVSLPSASPRAILLKNRDWIRSYPEVVLCLDNDDAGQEALSDIAKIVGYDRARTPAKYGHKDFCDLWLAEGGQAVRSAAFETQPYRPDGFMTGEALWESYKKKQEVIAVPYPECMAEVNEKLQGMRRGEILLLTSGTGSGKSTVVKEIILELGKYFPDQDEGVGKIGLMFLEEAPGDTTEKLIGMYLRKNMRKYGVEEEEEREAFDWIFGDDRIIVADHQGSISDDSIIDRLEYMILSGCTHIMLDHITIAVSEGDQDGKTGNEAVDALMSGLLKLVKRHNVWLGVVSHLRKTGQNQKPFEQGRLPSLDDIKGSGAIKQISFDILAFARDMTNEDKKVRNTVKLRVLKARETGETGDAGAMFYDADTTRMEFATIDFDEID
jgi:Toprim domain-containing protein/DnaB helicase-like protein